jgi:hypothetical protein
MLFILRAIFWLAVVSAVLPSRGDEPGLGETAGRTVGAAMDFCAAQPATCLERANASAEVLRIPADFVLRAQSLAATAPRSADVPRPLPRPSAL